MKRKTILVGLLLLAMFMLPLSSNPISDSSIEVDEYSALNLSEYESHDPISITSNADFITQGWPGNGTIENPYVIEDLLIDSVVYPEYPISISNTRANFVIRNCFLANFADDPYAGIGLSNSTNGAIENNFIDDVHAGVYVHDESSSISILNNTLVFIRVSDSSNVSITENDIVRGILLEVTYDVRVVDNNISGYNSYSGWRACINGLRCNNTQIVNNTIMQDYDYCIVLETTSQISIINNTCISGGHGIHAHWTSNVLVEGNYIEFYGEGIETEYCENWVYNNNTLIRVDDTPPIITPEADINYEVGKTGYEINWYVTEANPLNYSIIRDSIVVASGGEYGHRISISVDGLGVGVYDYILIVFDTRGSSDSDSVLVNVTEVVVTTTTTTTDTTTTTTTTDTTTTTTTNGTTTDVSEPYTIPLISIVLLFASIGGICGIIALVIVIKRR